MKEYTLSELKDKMNDHAGEIGTNRRKLVVCPHHDAYEEIGTVFLGLNGTPPKGFAIYFVEQRRLCFFEMDGKRWKNEKEVFIKEFLFSIFKDFKEHKL